MTLTAPAALWLLLAVPLVWAAQLVGRTNFNSRQRWLQAAVRSLLLVALAFALARPVISTASSRASVIYLVDVSHSISSAAIEGAAHKIDELNQQLRPDHHRVLAFAANALPLDDTNALRGLAKIEDAGKSRLDRSGTDLEGALAAARAELAPGHVPRFVLFTDGRPTAGDTAAAVARLSAEHIPVFVEPLAVRSLGDTWIESIELPSKIVAGGTFTATVVVGSQRPANATVEIFIGETPGGPSLRSPANAADTPSLPSRSSPASAAETPSLPSRSSPANAGERRLVATRQLSVDKGTTSASLDVVVDAPGASLMQAVVSVPGDPLTANNTLNRGIWTDPHPKVLYVEGRPASARYLSAALTASGYEVTVRPASGLPASVADLDPYDVVVLSDVRRAAIRETSMAALSEWVEQRGGGLLVAGGESVFGEGGYRKSPLERLTPVTFERRDEPEVALVLVLDRSWSMAGTSMDLCKSAAQAAVDVLTDEQLIGILTFNDSFNWDVTLRNVGRNRDAIRKRIDAIGPAGHTLIYPAIEQAYRALKPARARAKHVVLLSDGRSYPANYEELVRQMVDARITMSAVAVGPGADPELLGNIAKWGKGRYYAVSDAKELPQIFVKEAKNAATPAFDEKEIKPVVKSPAFLSGVDLARLPHLKGRNATVLKDTALQVLATDEDDPLLAFWPIGLGRTAVFASDVKDRWAADWVTWRGYGPFFTSVVRALERRRPSAMSLEVTPGPIRDGRRAIEVAVESRDPVGDYRNLIHPAVLIRSSARPRAEVSLPQVSPGRYASTVIVDAAQALTFEVDAREAGITSRLVLPDPAAEYRFRNVDEEALKSIASATGGTWMPTADALANHDGQARTERRPLWTALILAALVLWLVDITLRRIRLFESAANLQPSASSYQPSASS